MALPITIPNTFATESTNIPLSDLDANFATVSTAINGIGNGSEALANVVITGGSVNGAAINGSIDGVVIGASNAVAATFSTLTANAATFTSLTVTGGGGEESGGIAPTGSITMWAGAVASPPAGWLASSITGSSVTRGGGGGASIGGSGGSGGGGNAATGGSANTGGGGGGGYGTGGATGGSGVVILRMPTAKYTGTTTGSPTVTTNGANTILTFTSSGTYTA